MRQYNKEPNIHPLIFGTNGDVHAESWKYLTNLGFTIANLRDIQQIILKHTTLKIQDAMDINIHAWKQRDRNKRRRQNKNVNKDNAIQKGKNDGNSILEYINK